MAIKMLKICFSEPRGKCVKWTTTGVERQILPFHPMENSLLKQLKSAWSQHGELADHVIELVSIKMQRNKNIKGVFIKLKFTSSYGNCFKIWSKKDFLSQKNIYIYTHFLLIFFCEFNIIYPIPLIFPSLHIHCLPLQPSPQKKTK